MVEVIRHSIDFFFELVNQLLIIELKTRRTISGSHTRANIEQITLNSFELFAD